MRANSVPDCGIRSNQFSIILRASRVAGLCEAMFSDEHIIPLRRQGSCGALHTAGKLGLGRFYCA
jgi:hypothetical protein